ncbi:MAG TPA: DUF2892 domain-containing protein [Longimicrobiales bacterium]|nr:DUF2892 domain-containing protein [Longimicrobiales bacterium]
MTRNMGIVDRSARLLAVAVIAALYVTEQIGGTLAIALASVAVLFFVTSVIGWCPLYVPLGISTRKGARRQALKS